MNNYFELKIVINPDLEEIVADIFFSNFDCEGVVLEEETYKDLEMTSTTKGTLRVFLTSYPLNLYDILKTERELLKNRGLTDDELGSWEITLDEKENQDWSKKWKEKWTVTHVTDKIAVVPSWLDYTPKSDEVIIILDPGCAFGTGTHQTTQLCMKALEKYLNKGDDVADIGTGSGILAILAKKFGANSVYGCDIDETVIDVCKENAVINNTEAIFELNTADKITKKYDFVCANILHFVLAEIMGDLKNIMKPQALMSLSGILDEKKDMVLDAIRRENLQIIDTISQDQWVSYVVKKVD
ncbi:MAG: 50S ribosomal protein L11 methyltransferase [bacterium]|nr:50S ribosomal protein L11 methyltransferase [bacterium]